MLFADQLKYINSLNLSNNSNVRQDCPFCGGHNTFSVSRIDGQLKWFCFRASCKAHGIKSVDRSVSEIRQAIKHDHTEQKENFSLPERFVSPLNKSEVFHYLSRNHCLYAYENGLADIRYDPKLHRVVFVVKANGEPVDAVGRALNRDILPKWYRYGDSQFPFICGNSATVVIVEDAASACAVSPIATGFALLGTHLNYTHISKLKQFNNIVIALDKDASRKSLELHRRLASVRPTTVKLLADDLKYLEPSQIRCIIGLNHN